MFEAQNDMKSQAKKKKAKLKAEGGCWKQENHSLNSPGVDQRDSHKLQQRQRSNDLFMLDQTSSYENIKISV